MTILQKKNQKQQRLYLLLGCPLHTQYKVVILRTIILEQGRVVLHQEIM